MCQGPVAGLLRQIWDWRDESNGSDEHWEPQARRSERPWTLESHFTGLGCWDVGVSSEEAGSPGGTGAGGTGSEFRLSKTPLASGGGEERSREAIDQEGG